MKTYEIEVHTPNQQPRVITVETTNIEEFMKSYSRNRMITNWTIIQESAAQSDNLLLG